MVRGNALRGGAAALSPGEIDLVVGDWGDALYPVEGGHVLGRGAIDIES